MEAMILAIGLQNVAWFKLHIKSQLFANLSSFFILLFVVYIIYGFIKFEWWVPVIGFFIATPLVAMVQALVESILDPRINRKNDSSSVEILYSVVAFILVMNS